MTTTRYKKQRVPEALKSLVWSTYIGSDIAHRPCPLCGLNEISMRCFDCAHVLAEIHGGTMTIDNLRPICGTCNSSMGTQNMRDWVETYAQSSCLYRSFQQLQPLPSSATATSQPTTTATFSPAPTPPSSITFPAPPLHLRWAEIDADTRRQWENINECRRE
jgi:hypothetical protein